MNLTAALNLAGVVFFAVLSGFMCLDEIVNTGTKPNGSWTVGLGGACAFFCAWAAYLAARS